MAVASPITLKTETEHLLYKRYQDERTERRKLESLVIDLKSQIEELQRYQKHIQEQQVPIKSSDTEIPLSDVQYETDEEDLAKETEWVRQKSRKKGS